MTDHTDHTPPAGIPVTPLTVEDLERHIGKMAELQSAMEQHDAKLDEAREVAFKSQRLARLGIKCAAIGGVATIAAILLAIGAWLGVAATNDARADARLGGCLGDNRILERVRSGIVEINSYGLAQAFARDPNNLTADEQLIYDTYRNAMIVKAGEIIFDRDCSKKGIEDFFYGVDEDAPTAGP